MQQFSNLEELKSQIEVDRELLHTMPQNNAKNIAKYQHKLEEIQNEYKQQRDEIYSILEKRYYQKTNIKQSEEIREIDNKIQEIERDLYILDDKTTPYEKMKLDKYIYKLRKFYKENLEVVNEQISLILNKFFSVEIDLELSDFDYSIYANKYMEVFLEEKQKGNLSSERIKTTFEEIYWKCPEIITHIELNFRSLYLKMQPQIAKYYDRKKQEILNKWKKTPQEIFELYQNLVFMKQEKISKSKKQIIDELLDGTLNPKNFEHAKILSNLSKILPEQITDNIEQKEQEIKQNIFKFLNSLNEYKNFEEFKFILEDIKTYYKQKDQYKNIYEETKKLIDGKEKQLKKLNKKNDSKGFIFKKNSQQNNITLEQNALIIELRDLYKKLDLDKFYNKIYSNLTDNSTIIDVLSLASDYYEFLVSCIIKNDQTIIQEDIDLKIEKLKEYLSLPTHTLINNITIMEEKNMATIIKDRYKLLDFKVEKEDLELGNIDNLISTLELIKKGFDIKDSGLDVETLEEITELKKVLKK